MSNLRGTNISAAVVPFTTDDTYASHYAKYGQGGWRSVDTLEDLNLITDDRLEKGMAVYVVSEEKPYILTDLDLTADPVVKTWTEMQTGGDTIQVEEFPEITPENLGQIVEYIGETEPSGQQISIEKTTVDECTVTVDEEYLFDNMREFFRELPEGQSAIFKFVYAGNDNWNISLRNYTNTGTLEEISEGFGITIDYGAGEPHVDDTIIITASNKAEPYYVNGYFYQATFETYPDEFVTNYGWEDTGDNHSFHTTLEDKDTYKNYITEVLHEELTDKRYRFEYVEESGEEGYWKDSETDEPVNLLDYGIAIEYDEGYEEIPAMLYWNDQASNPHDLESISIDQDTFRAWAEQVGFDFDRDYNDLYLKYVESDDYWYVFNGEGVRASDLESTLGILLDFGSGRPYDGESIEFYMLARHEEAIPGSPREGDYIDVSYFTEFQDTYWKQKDVSGTSKKIDKWVSFPQATRDNLGFIAEYVGEDEIEESLYMLADYYGDFEVEEPLNKTAFETALKGSGFSYLVKYVVANYGVDATLDLFLSYKDEENGWVIKFYNEDRIIGWIKTAQLPMMGITLQNVGELHEDDGIVVSYVPAHKGTFQHGLFYKSSYVKEDSYGDAWSEQGNVHEISFNINKYEDYIQNTLHQELEGGDFTFNYDENEGSWLLNDSPVVLANYGLHIFYNQIQGPIAYPAWYEFNRSESRINDSSAEVSFTVDLESFEAFLGQNGFTPQEYQVYDIELIYQEGQDNWRVSFRNVTYFGDMTQQDIEDICGITFEYTQGRLSDGDMLIANYTCARHALVDDTAHDGDYFTLRYNAPSYEYKWVEAEVQGHKIDKFEYLPEPSSNNEGLIAQYVGDLEIPARFRVDEAYGDRWEIKEPIDTDKLTEKIASDYSEYSRLFSEGDTSATYFRVEFEMYSGDENRRARLFIGNYTSGEYYNVDEVSVSALGDFGIYFITEPQPGTWGGVLQLIYEPEYSPYTRGYFYESVNQTIDENVEISDLENLELDEDNPYTVDIDTYRDFIDREGRVLDYEDITFVYGTVSSDESSEEEAQGWYNAGASADPETGLPIEVDLEGDYGTTLNYKHIDKAVEKSLVVSGYYNQCSEDNYIFRGNVDRFEQLLQRCGFDIPTTPTTYSFVAGTQWGNDWVITEIGGGTSSLSGSAQVYSADYGINCNIEELGIITSNQGWLYPFPGDHVTFQYLPAVTTDDEPSAQYFVSDCNIGFTQFYSESRSYTDVGYIESVDINTFESYVTETLLEDLPTEATAYVWECTDGDTNKWALNGYEANPSDYGITLHQNRAPVSLYCTGDTFTVIYNPANTAEAFISHTRFQGSENGGGIAYFDQEVILANTALYDLYDDYLTPVTVNLVCRDDGWVDDVHWYCQNNSTQYSSADLQTEFGIELNAPRAPIPYMTGDIIAITINPLPEAYGFEPSQGSSFKWRYSPEQTERSWEQRDVQPHQTLSINGVELTNETTTTDLGLMDLSTNQTAEGRKIINELYKSEGTSLVAINSNTMIPLMNFNCASILPRDGDTAFIFGSMTTEEAGSSSIWGVTVKEYPAFGIINKEDGTLVDGRMYPLHQDPSGIWTRNGYGQAFEILWGFVSNVVEWYDERNNNKKWLFALTSPCILAKIDPDYLTPDNYRSAVVESYQINDFGDFYYYKRTYNRIRVQGDRIYIFQEMGEGSNGGCFAQKFDIRNPYISGCGSYSTYSAGGYWDDNYRMGSWGFYIDKESGYDYQIMTVNNVDYAYCFANMVAPSAYTFTDINGNRVEYPNGTIYKFPLNNSRNSDNLEYLGYQFDIYGIGKCKIQNIIKINEQYLLVYSYDGSENRIRLSLFDVTSDQVVSVIKCRARIVSDDYKVTRTDPNTYVVSGFMDEGYYLYQVTIDVSRGTFNERDDEFLYESGYRDVIYRDSPLYLTNEITVFMWNNTNIINLEEIGAGRGYIFDTPVIYTKRQTTSGNKNNFIWVGISQDLDRYATEGYVDSIISTSGFISADYLVSNGYATQNWCNSYNINYNNLNYLPSLNGITIAGNFNSRYYRIIDDYGINITDTQMLMNDKGIRYDTPFQIATVFAAGGGSEYSEFEMCYIIPSKTENNVYYQVVKYKYEGSSTPLCGIFKYNTLLDERTQLMEQSNGKFICGTYDYDRDTLALILGTMGTTSLVYVTYENISSDNRSRQFESLYEVQSSYTRYRRVDYGTVDDLIGLFVDNCKVEKPESGYTLSYNMFIHNTKTNRTYGGNLTKQDSAYYYKYATQSNFAQTTEDFIAKTNDINRHVSWDGAVGLVSTRDDFKMSILSTFDYTKPQATYCVSAFDWHTNTFIGVGLPDNWSTSYYTLQDITGEGTDYAIPNPYVAVATKVYVDDVRVLNYTVVRDDRYSASSNRWKVVFDTPVASGSVVTAQFNSQPGGIVFMYDGTDWTVSDGIVMPTVYEDPNNGILDVSYEFLVVTDDPTNRYVAIAQINGYAYATCSSDGLTWSSLVQFPYQTTLIGVEYVASYIYYFTIGGSVYIANEQSPFINVNNYTSFQPETPRSVCYANGKFIVLDAYRYQETGYTSNPYVYGIRFWEYDIAEDTWSIVGNPMNGIFSTYYDSQNCVIKYDGEFFHVLKKSSYSDEVPDSNNYWYVSKDLYNFQSAIDALGRDLYYLDRYSDNNGVISGVYTSIRHPAGFCGDGQGGLYQLQFRALYTNSKGVWASSEDTDKRITAYRIAGDRDTTPYFYPSGNYPVAKAKFDTNNTTLLDNNYDCYGTVGCGFINKSVDSGTYNSISYIMDGAEFIMKGTNNNAYLAHTYNVSDNFTDNWNAYFTPSSTTMGYGTVITQSTGMAFIYMLDDDSAFIRPGSGEQSYYLSSNTANAASIMNSFSAIANDQGVIFNARDGYARFKTAPFHVVPTYYITNIIPDSSNIGTGYQAGETFSIEGIFSDGLITPSFRIETVDGNGGVTSISVLNGGRFMDMPRAYSPSNITITNYSGSGTGLKVRVDGCDTFTGSHNGGWEFGGLTVHNNEIITPDLSQADTSGWMKESLVLTDNSLVELHGSFENEGGILSIEAIDCRNVGDSADLTKHYFYCLIKTVNGTSKAYVSDVISSFRTYPNGIQLTECSADLSEATSGTNYTVSYLAQHAFVYSPDNFYVTSPAFVNFKGKITDLYDTNFMELYTSHPTTGFVVPALGNRRLRNTFTKPSDFNRYYYNYKSVVSGGANWEPGVHTATTVFDTTDGDLAVTVVFETDTLGQLKQVFSISPELGKYPLNTTNIAIENPDTMVQADDIVLNFETIDLDNGSFIPSIEKYGIVKRGYQVKDDMDVVSGYTDSESIPTVYAVKQYVDQHGGGTSASAVQLTLDSSDWNSTTHEQTIQNITGLDVSSIIVVVPAPNSMTDYMSANIVCTGQATGELTFTYTGIAPTNNITVNVLIM